LALEIGFSMLSAIINVEIQLDQARHSTGVTPRNAEAEARQFLKGGQAMMRFSRLILNALLATSLAAGFAVAQDAPPPPDSQYPATSDVAQNTPQYEKQSDPVYATPNSQTADQGGYPQTAQDQDQDRDNAQPASAPPPPSGDMQAENTPQSDDDSQDPSSRVARMQIIDGQVSIQPGGVNDWVAGTLNRPLTSGDNVWTDKNSRSELNVGTGVFRMGSETSVTLANVADKTTQLQLHQGTLNLRVRHLYDGEVYEIDTPNMAFTVQKPGDYRFDVDPNADTSYVTVWKGEGNATGDGPSVVVREHEKARFSNGTSMAYEINKAPGYDQFDQWAMGRDERDDHSKSAKYVSPDVIGSSDLDDYGRWNEDSEYGNVWVPNDQDDDFQPYSNGNWIYQQPYGWTWVGYEPWGFAPYHYGRWVHGGWGWGWAPGPYAYWGSPYYAPAMVAWFGGGGFGIGWGGGFGLGGGWGWCALGWGDPFRPWYHGGRGYFNRVNIRNTRINNITNITNNYYNNRGTINNHYANAGRGLVATNGRTISNGMSVRNNRVTLNNSQRSQMIQHPAATHQLGNQLRPTAQGRVGAQAANRHAAVPPARATSRPTFNHTPPVSHGAINARGNGGTNTARPSAGINNGRNAGGTGINMSRPLSNNRSTTGTDGNAGTRDVPRPPSAGGATSGGQMNHSPAGGNNSPGTMPANRGASTGGNSNTGTGNGHYVPRPPSAGGTMGNRSTSNMPSAMGRSSNNVARPGGTYSRPGQSYSSPRPSASTSQPSRGYSAPSRSYSSPSYNNPGNGRSYSSPSNGRSYSSPNPGRSYGSPSYNARSYGGPSPSRSYSSPSYGGGRSYSAPSNGGGRGYSAPSGGGHYSAPSAPAYHGGGGGYSGGGHASGGYSGGGGHASAGGGGHASGGGGGGHTGHR
jgi:hypothetical protein